jgi:chemotaxis protein MotA
MKVPWAWFQVAFLARAGVSNGHFYGPRPACRGDRRSDHDFHGRRSADVYQRSRRDHHFRRVVCRHADPLPAVIDVSRPPARRQIRLHHAAHDPARAGRRDCRQGPIGLEKVEIEDPFLAKGIRFVADGYDAEFIRDNLERDRDNFLTHLDEGQKIYRAVGDCAPAFGMIGTLIGMVQMFANMTDPSKLGPFMATALLATLYGAVLANIICLPIADKLHGKLVDEEINRTLIIDGVLMIRESKSPTLVREMLVAYLPEKHRSQEPEPVPA